MACVCVLVRRCLAQVVINSEKSPVCGCRAAFPDISLVFDVEGLAGLCGDERVHVCPQWFVSHLWSVCVL